MERRDFIKTSSAALLAVTMPQWQMEATKDNMHDAIIIGGHILNWMGLKPAS